MVVVVNTLHVLGFVLQNNHLYIDTMHTGMPVEKNSRGKPQVKGKSWCAHNNEEKSSNEVNR